MSCLAGTRVYARFEPITNPARPDGERVRGQSEPQRQLPAILDLGALLAPIVFKDQVPFILSQRLQASFETVERFFSSLFDSIKVIAVGAIQIDHAVLLYFGPAEILEEHELRDDVTVVSGRRVNDGALFVETAGNAIQRFVGEFVSGQTPFAGEIPDQPAAHVEIVLTVGFPALVEPSEELMECLRTWRPAPLRH